MINIISLLINLVSSQNCFINQTLGSQLYPTSGSPFALPLLNYISGPGLNFSVNPDNQFKVSQYVTQKSFNQSLFNENQIIQMIALENANGYASLVVDSGQYLVFVGNQSAEGLTSSLIGIGIGIISIQSYISCTNIVQYNNYILVSCYDRQGFLIFYYYNLNNDSYQLPQLVIPTGGIQIDSYYYYTWLTSSNESLSYVVSNPIAENAYIYFYEIIIENDQISIEFEENKTTQAIQGYYAAYNQFIFIEVILYYNQLSITIPFIETYNMSAQDQQIFKGLGVQCNYAEFPLITCFLAIASSQGVQNFKMTFSQEYPSFLVVQQGQLIQYPPRLPPQPNFDNIVIYLNQEYVYCTNGQHSIVFPGYSNSNTQYIWYQYQNFTYGILFNPVSSVFGIIQNTQYDIYQIYEPYLITDQISNSVGQVVVTAVTNSIWEFDQFQCQLKFNYSYIEKTQSQPLSTFGEQNVLQNQLQMDYPFNSTQQVSPYFYGSNMTYNVTTNDTNTQANVLQVNIQSFYNPTRFSILYSQIISNPNNTNQYMIATQVSNKNYIDIQYCYFSDCLLDSSEQYNFAIEQGMVAQKIAVGYNYYTYVHILCIQFTNPRYSFYCLDFNWGKPITQFISVILNTYKPLPTTTISDFGFVDNTFYVITQNPSFLQFYQSAQIYNLETQPQIIYDVNFNPRRLFYNTEIYKNLLFIDNVYQLLIMQNFENNLVIQQTIQYPIQQGDCTVGVGLLSQGIYIAQSDGQTNQIIQYYPKIIISQYASITINNNPQYINIPNSVIINNPVVTTFTNDKFYIAWTYQNLQQVGILQQSYGINNMLYYSQFINGKLIYQLSSSQTQQYDVIDCLADQQSETILNVFNQTTVEFIQKNLSLTNQTVSVNYTASFQNQQTQISQTLQLINLKSQVVAKTNFTYNQTQNNLYYFAIQPQNYFIGLVKYYNVTTSSYRGGPLQNLGIIQPIYSSNIFCNIAAQGLGTGTLTQYGDYQLSFAQTNKSVYTYYQLKEQGLVSYTLLYNFTQYFSSCPIILQITHCMLSICTLQSDGSTYLSCYNQKNNVKTILTVPYSTNYSNIISAQYLDSYLVLQYQDFFVFNYLVESPESLEIGYLNQSNITNLQISQWSFIYFSDIFYDIFPYYGIVATAENGKSALMFYGFEFSSIQTVAIQFNPIITEKIISIYQKVGVFNETYFQMEFIVQTITNGYVYNLVADVSELTSVFQTPFNSYFEAQQQQILIQYGALQAIFMQYMDNYAVTVYSSGSQTVAGVYSFYDTNQTYLSFIGYIDSFYNNSQPTKFVMTNNGTLYYYVDNGFSMLYTQSAPQIAVNYSQLDGYPLNNRTMEFYNLFTNLTAVNDFSSASAQFTIVNYQYYGSQPNSNWSGSKSVWFGSVALLFAVIFLGTLSFLCYKSRPQSTIDYP